MRTPIGTFLIDNEQPPLSSAEIDVICRFHDLYYQHWLRKGAATASLSWFGHEIVKCPLDLWIYQELLVRTRPDLVIETGTWAGGSALYIAMLLDHIGHGSVVTIDIEPRANRPTHPRITYLTGSSVDPSIVAVVAQRAAGKHAMVILDSDHSAEHVYQEMLAYSPLVWSGDYLIVEDTNVNGHPIWPNFGPGPWEAVGKFLSETDDFIVDERCERFLMTQNPRGYLRRK